MNVKYGKHELSSEIVHNRRIEQRYRGHTLNKVALHASVLPVSNENKRFYQFQMKTRGFTSFK
jgi:hypothetical protein